MPKLVASLPKYRRHKASGQAMVTIAGKDHYLGPKAQAILLPYLLRDANAFCFAAEESELQRRGAARRLPAICRQCTDRRAYRKAADNDTLRFQATNREHRSQAGEVTQHPGSFPGHYHRRLEDDRDIRREGDFYSRWITVAARATTHTTIKLVLAQRECGARLSKDKPSHTQLPVTPNHTKYSQR